MMIVRHYHEEGQTIYSDVEAVSYHGPRYENIPEGADDNYLIEHLDDWLPFVSIIVPNSSDNPLKGDEVPMPILKRGKVLVMNEAGKVIATYFLSDEKRQAPVTSDKPGE